MRGSLALSLLVAAAFGCSDPEPGDADAATDGDLDADGSGAIDTPRPFFPWNGYTTGSVHVPLDAPTADHPLRPLLRWLPVPRATSYEIEIDDTCMPGSFRTCAFESIEVSGITLDTSYRPAEPLEVARVAPVGRRYYWRVRACGDGSCSAWSEPRYLDVGRQPNDFDGDGYADVVIGARDLDAPQVDEGTVYVFYGSARGLVVDPHAIDDPSDQANAYFGTSIAAVGDLDADGYGDLAVGAQGYDGEQADEGNAFVFYGRASGLASTPDVEIDSPEGAAGGLFGAVVTGAGDLDGDGYADLAVDAAGTASRRGKAFVFYGRAMGVGRAPDVAIENPLARPNTSFGHWMDGAGDVDGDGYSDLAIGAYELDAEQTDEGGAFLYHGGVRGLETEPRTAFPNPSHVAEGAFGVRVLGGVDLDRDGYADLAITAHGQSMPEPKEGGAFVFAGSAMGVDPDPTATVDNPADEALSRFGAALGGGDLDGDGYDDLAVGAYLLGGGDNDGEGAAYVYPGSDDGIGTGPRIELANPTGQTDGSFGIALASPGDIDGDGYDDLVVGAYLQTSEVSIEGVVYVYYGSADGIATTPDLEIVNPAHQPSSGFGRSVATRHTSRRARSTCVEVGSARARVARSRPRRRRVQ